MKFLITNFSFVVSWKSITIIRCNGLPVPTSASILQVVEFSATAPSTLLVLVSNRDFHLKMLVTSLKLYTIFSTFLVISILLGKVFTLSVKSAGWPTSYFLFSQLFIGWLIFKYYLYNDASYKGVLLWIVGVSCYC